jgi:murein L,D-transpeptidase YcbB/YkuD
MRLLYLQKRIILPYSLLLFFYILCFLQSCQNNSNGREQKPFSDTLPSPDLSIPGSFSDQRSLSFDSSFINEFIVHYPKWQPYEKEIHSFYQKRNYAYAWYDQQGMIEQAWNLYNKIENIAEEGVSIPLLYEPELHRMMDDTAGIDHHRPDVLLDVMLTAQYFFYAKHIWNGLGLKGMQAIAWDLPRKKMSYEQFLDSILNIPSAEFMMQEPNYHQYKKLKAQLKQYRNIANAGGWDTISFQKKSIRIGDSNTIILKIRNRLVKTGELQSYAANPFFDDTLELAVKQFQKRHGLNEDGIVGKSVIEAMNVRVEKRIEQIIVNMERCRWLPIELKDQYFVINIPDFRFFAYSNDTLLWSMKVVVGKSITETAIFTGTMKYVVFAPYWNVPESILQKEILPEIQQNKNYLEKNHMEWAGKTLRQKPGPWNALGKVKFLFPNSHNIYLHDTPSKDLFKRDQRTFSHGCIRVEQPKKLAQYVLQNQPEWPEKRIDSAMNGEKELYVTLKKTFPVFIAYFTSWVDEKGLINFRKDIYGKDDRLLNMIVEKKSN